MYSIQHLFVLVLVAFHFNPCLSKIHISRFDISRFEVNLGIDTSQIDVSTPSHHLAISSDLKSATISYLMDYIESIIVTQAADEESKQALEDIQLELSLNAASDSEDSNSRRLRTTVVNNERKTLTAEMAGSIYFTKNNIGPNLVLNQDKIDNLFNEAFRGNYAMSDYLAKLQVIIKGVVSVEVLSHEDLNKIAAAEKAADGGKKSGSAKVGTVLLVLIILATTFALCALIYREYQIRRFGGRRSRKGHLLMGTEIYSDYYDDDDTGYAEEMNHSSSSYDTEPVQFIPVPARIDEVKDGKKVTKPTNPDVTPRRFVSPASPFDLLYGAAFSHRDQAKVQSAHGIKVRKKLHRLSKTPKGKDLNNPLNTISEGEDEEEGNESFFPQIMSTISSYISDKRDATTAYISEKREAATATIPKTNDDFVVYRDFPRHDGTPCVMFAPVEEEMYAEDNIPPASAFQSNLDSMKSNNDKDILYGPSDYSYPNDDKEDADCFVDKLENLMAARSRQYEERKIMHEEMSERKRRHKEQRLREKDAAKVDTETSQPVQDGDSCINLRESSGMSVEEKHNISLSDDEVKVANLLSPDTTTEESNEKVADLLSINTTAEESDEKVADLLSINTATEESNNQEFPYIHNNDSKEMSSDTISTSMMPEQQSGGDNLEQPNDIFTCEGSSIKSTSIVPEIETIQTDDDIPISQEILDEDQEVNRQKNNNNVDVPNTKHIISESSISPRDVETLHFQDDEEEEEVPQKQESTNMQNIITVKEDPIM